MSRSYPTRVPVPHWYAYPPKCSYTDAAGIPHEEVRIRGGQRYNIYVHVPFCSMKCSFCSLFASTGSSDEVMLSYANLLIREIDTFRQNVPLGSLQVENLYFGGGTPALMGEPFLSSVLGALAKLGDLPAPHQTVEFSPDVVSNETANCWRKHRFNRASIGVQTFDDRILSAIRRRHTASDAQRAVALLADAGFESINVDLIFGLDGQSDERWAADLDSVVATRATCCTFHPLATTPKTKFERKLIDTPAGVDALARMHAQAIDFFEGLGWKRTSAISYAIEGRPNPLEYAEAHGIPTVGFGAGARSYFRDLHTSGLPSSRRMAFGQVLQNYSDTVMAGRRPALSLIHLNKDEQLRRELVLQMHHGLICSDTLHRALNVLHRSDLEGSLSHLIDSGFLLPSDEGHLLTAYGAVHASEIGFLLASQRVQEDITRMSVDAS